MGGYDLGERRRLSQPEVAANLAVQVGGFPDAVPVLRDRLGPKATAADAVDAFVAGSGLEPDAARWARQALRSVLEADAADRVDRVSLRWLWHEIEYGGDFFGDLPDGGYRSLVDAMAAGVEVRLGQEVAEIAADGGGVRLRTADGAVLDGSHALVTVPLGVLKRGAPRFAPALPADKAAAIERLGFGRYEKVALRFRTAFWRDAGLSHLLLFPADPDQVTLWVFDLDAFGAGPVLVAHVFHSTSGRVLDGTPEQAGDWVLDQLGAALGSPCPRPVAVAVTDWSHDPFSCGAYGHVPPWAEPADLDLLGEPAHGRVLFAGEHTQSARTGYADGAMSSGIREAKRLLRRPDVDLASGG
jgi:monoamine oxidase